MDNYIAYFDETGDDGANTASSKYFVLTSLYMSTSDWQSNFNAVRAVKQQLKQKYGFHVSQELHTKHLLTDKNPYRNYNWSPEEKREIIKAFVLTIADLKASAINVLIDKTKFIDESYPVLENALKYNIQRIENDSKGKWHYLIITDKGRLPPMRKTARAIRASNPIQSKYAYGFSNHPITGLIEDILEKDSQESYFIQICDLMSYFVHLYYNCVTKKEPLPNRVAKVIDIPFIKSFMATLKKADIFNLNANKSNAYGLVIYPK
jgi:hypothetical protein